MNLSNLIDEYRFLAQTLHSERSRNAAKGLADDLTALQKQLHAANNDFKGDRLAAEQKQLTAAFLSTQEGLVKHAAQLRTQAATTLPAVKNPFPYEQLQELRAVLRPGIMAYAADGMPQFDNLKLTAMLDSAMAQGRLNYVWAIVTAPDSWVDDSTKAGVLAKLTEQTHPNRAAEAKVLLYDASELETQYNRVKTALAA